MPAFSMSSAALPAKTVYSNNTISIAFVWLFAFFLVLGERGPQFFGGFVGIWPSCAIVHKEAFVIRGSEIGAKSRLMISV